jgi:hypothetical protein
MMKIGCWKLKQLLQNKKNQCVTLYKNNSGLVAKMKVNKYKKGQCLTEKLVRENPLLFLY